MGSNIDALIASGIKAPEVEPPGMAAMRWLQMRDLQQQMQLRSQLAPLQIAGAQQEQQQRQMDIDQRQAVNKAYQDAFTADPSTGAMSLDTDKLTKALATGGHGSAIQPILEGVTKYKQELANFQKTNADLDIAHKNLAGAGAYALRASNYDPNLMGTFVRDMVNNKLIPSDQGDQVLAHMQEALQQDPTGNTARAFIKPYVDRAWMESPEQQRLETERQTAQRGAAAAETEKRQAAQQDWLGAVSRFAAHPPSSPAAYQNFLKALPPDTAARFTQVVPPEEYDPAKSPGMLRQAALTPEQQTQALKPPAEKENEATWIATLADPNASAQDKATAKQSLDLLAKQKRAGQPPPGAVTLMVPNANGGYTATRVTPGQSVGTGAVTPTQLGSTNVPTAATRTMAETAPKVLALTGRMRQLLDANEKQLGPLASRWQEFAAGKIGLPNQGYTQLRTNAALLQTALMRMHVGARGGEQMMDHFKNLIDQSIQDPQNLRAALDEIDLYAKQVAAEGGPRGTTPPPAQNKNPFRK